MRQSLKSKKSLFVFVVELLTEVNIIYYMKPRTQHTKLFLLFYIFDFIVKYDRNSRGFRCFKSQINMNFTVKFKDAYAYWHFIQNMLIANNLRILDC